ncbi:MAG: ABC transporter substrate-binding protein [Acholeplasmataceae bacterium]
MKKILLLLVLSLFAVGLVACGGGDEVPTDNNTQTPGGGQIIELTYADWANPEFSQKMIDAFMDEYPNIRVTLRSDIAGSGAEFTGNLVTAAQAGLLPDVFATDNVPVVVNAGLTLDVADFWANDSDTDLVYENIKNTAVYNGHRYAVPSFQFFKGIFINLSIFENANLTTVAGKYRIDNDGYPVKDWTFSEFVEIGKVIKNFDLQNPENLVVGISTWYGAPDFNQVWPTMEDEATLYDTWDGEKFNYTSAAWIQAMEAKVALHQLTDGTTTRFTPEDYEANPVLQQYLIAEGYAAMAIEGSWQFWMYNETVDEFNLGFWPYPQGSAGFFPPTILDYVAVSVQTDHPEEAYLLAKWMTYGQDGWNARLDIYEDNKQEALDEGVPPVFLDRFPIAEYPGVWDRVYGLVDGIEGIGYTIDNIQNAKPDLDKWLPGYNAFWSWVYDPENPWNFDNLILAGPTAVATYAQQWENKANEIVQAEINALGNN